MGRNRHVKTRLTLMKYDEAKKLVCRALTYFLGGHLGRMAKVEARKISSYIHGAGVGTLCSVDMSIISNYLWEIYRKGDVVVDSRNRRWFVERVERGKHGYRFFFRRV